MSPFSMKEKPCPYLEQANIPKKMVKPFEDEIPNYEASLKTALRNFKLELEEDSSPFADAKS